MGVVRFTSRSLEDSSRFAAALAGIVRAGDTIALRGDLGAGKTTIARMLCGALGADEGMVSSPTFVIAQEYPIPGGVPMARVVHIDAYRLRSAEELEDAATGAFAPDAVTLVEWPERCEGVLPEGRFELRIEHAGGGDDRRLALAVPEGRDADGVLRLAGAVPSDRVAATPGRAVRVDTTCPVTGRAVPADSPTWPFSDERARMADLERWFSGRYTLSRPAERSDIEEGD